MAYVFPFWTCYVLYHEYKRVATMRLQFLASETRRPDQFSVLARNVPPDTYESVDEHVDHFFCVNHPDHYLTYQAFYNANTLAKMVSQKKGLLNRLRYYQNKYERNSSKKPTTKTGFCGFWGTTVDAIDYYTDEIDKLSKEVIDYYTDEIDKLSKEACALRYARAKLTVVDKKAEVESSWILLQPLKCQSSSLETAKSSRTKSKWSKSKKTMQV